MRSRSLLLFAALLGLIQAASAQQLADTAAREAYKANLTACVSRAKACDKGKLTKADQDYLSFEMGEKRFTKQDVDEVVGVRMAWLGKEPQALTGRATGKWPDYNQRLGPGRPGESGPEVLVRNLGGCVQHVQGYYRSNGAYVSGYDRYANESRC